MSCGVIFICWFIQPEMQDSNQYESHPNASQRITELFIELLDRQFPVDYPNANFKSAHSCRLRKPPVCTR